MRGAKAAAAAERTEEKEMDLLLREIPHVTSPQGQRGAIGHGNGVHGAAAGHGFAAQGRGEDAYYSMALHRRDDAAPLQGGGGGGGAPGGMPFAAPLPVVSAPSPASGPFVGSAPPPPPLARAVDDPEQQWLANHLRELRIGDAPAAGAQSVLQRHGPPPVKSAVSTPTDASAARDAYHGYNFAAPGSSVHHEPVFLDQTKAVGYVAARPQRFVSDVGFDAYGGFPRGLDTSIGGLVYNRVGHGTGIGWGQGLVHPDLADSYMLSRHNGAEFFCPSPVALDVRGGPKLQYAYTVPVADNGFARSGNQFEAFHSENSLMTRAVQKLIETVTTREQVVLIISALQPGFMELVNDLNGNHLTALIWRNYVVQYVLNLKIPSANAHLASQFEGRYLYLSKQKVSSNVVEKCLKLFPDDAKAVIVRELLSGSHFEQLLQDPYANYVIYTALLNTRGHLHNALVEAIRPHEDAIRTSPCCKRISRALSRR
ncbi:hypothetical protein HU200_003838 [Digitaria exilis]|uniref:PUM-HD domain-containing protein n=1 Tax=Digitaria exilis TaxID=1010633 RepID=A0A835FUR4_9POAL|nr:hypothetical protein HU200_003838 [Digitaria exilis]